MSWEMPEQRGGAVQSRRKHCHNDATIRCLLVENYYFWALSWYFFCKNKSVFPAEHSGARLFLPSAGRAGLRPWFPGTAAPRFEGDSRWETATWAETVENRTVRGAMNKRKIPTFWEKPAAWTRWFWKAFSNLETESHNFFPSLRMKKDPSLMGVK